ncbi:MBL fold metallo-hydrolase [Massilia sp. CF038]|uniref:MBL fold metallo-hydrolase n=1 Tax=Massilia sp. CF038 TaxID=1881045 RepID=UPI00091A5384|nr:MBL fold metallo-hydrolase [Massilia sp. CF038]SHG63243.1 Glyoxylase, beta-lactamase superfamily II [Massilia sp. CF038]
MTQAKLKQLVQASLIASAFAISAGHPASAAAPLAKTNAPGFHRIMLGNFEVTALSDGTVDLPVDQLLAEKPAKTTEALSKVFLKAPLETSVNTFLINTGSKLVLVDTGAASLFGPTLGKLLANLKASGYDAAQIDEIYITHMHPDHVGGLAQGAAAAFPNAVVRADKRDADFWLSQANLDAAPAASKGFFQGAMGAIKPYQSGDKFKPFDGKTELVPGIVATPSYGHTPGHTAYTVTSEGKTLLLIGDLIHVPAVQMGKPGVTIQFDSDAKAASAARAKVFAQAAKEGTMIGASHISFPGMGHLRSAGKGYEWVPVNYTQLR